MKISAETSIYIALKVIKEFKNTLKGKKRELLKELTSNEVKLLDIILMRLVNSNFYVALRLAIDEQCKDLEI